MCVCVCVVPSSRVKLFVIVCSRCTPPQQCSRISIYFSLFSVSPAVVINHFLIDICIGASVPFDIEVPLLFCNNSMGGPKRREIVVNENINILKLGREIIKNKR